MADLVDDFVNDLLAEERALGAVPLREEPERLEFDHLFFCGHLKAILAFSDESDYPWYAESKLIY